MTETEVFIDWPAVKARLLEAALQGLNATIDWTTEQARMYAPVRKVFQSGGERRRTERVPRGVHRYDTAEEMNAFTEMFRRSRQRQMQVDIHLGEERTRRVGRANSFIPIFKEGSDRVTGLQSPRRLATDMGGRPVLFAAEGGRPGFRLATQTELRGGKGRPLTTSADVTGEFRQMNPNVRLGREGRKEMKFALKIEPIERALETGKVSLRRGRMQGQWSSWRRSAIYRSASGATLGGRLRGEIYAEHATDTGGDTFTGYVVSPTWYAFYQEYGTRRHRAQPFMRPALYDSRAVLHDNVKRAMARSG